MDLQTQIQNSKFILFQKEWATVLQKKKETGWGICPVCRNGILQKKKSSRKKEFYQCNRFPDCEFVSYELPESLE